MITRSLGYGCKDQQNAKGERRHQSLNMKKIMNWTIVNATKPSHMKRKAFDQVKLTLYYDQKRRLIIVMVKDLTLH